MRVAVRDPRSGVIRSLIWRWLAVIALIVPTFALAARPASAQSPEPRSGGILRTVGVDPTTLDPHLVADSRSADYLLEIYSGLVTINAQSQIVPDLAERWEVSPDGTVFTFTLVPEATFHDGRPVTAADVKYSIERAADPATRSPVAETYLGDIVGVREKLAGAAAEVSGVQALDDRTVEITTDAPKIYFIAKLTYPTAFVVDRDAVETGPDWWAAYPNGTGPFQLRAYLPGLGLFLTRNDLFYRQPAYVDVVTFDLQGGSWLDRYENDQIDFHPGIGAADVDDVFDPTGPFFADLVRDANGNPGVIKMSTGYIGFNVNQPPFDDVRVRQAFNHAVDKRLINQTIARNLSLVANGVLPPSMPGFNAGLRGLAFDPALARRLLAESKYGSSLPPVKLTVAGFGGTLTGQVAALVDQWQRNLGVRVEVEQVDWISFLEDTRLRRPQMFELGWNADYPDPSNFLDVLFHSTSEENHTGYANREVDRLLEAARGERDVATRLAFYQQAEQIIVRDGAWLPLSHDKDYPLVKPWVRGLELGALGVPHLRYVWLDR